MIISLKIKKFVELLLEFISTDYTEATDKTKSWLYRVLQNDIDGDYNFYTNAVEVFVGRGKGSRRKIEVRNGFDPDRATEPTIHVREPSKSKGKTDTIGLMGEGYYTNEDGTVSTKLKYSNTSRFELLITGVNMNEIILIQEVLESAMMAYYEDLVLLYFDIMQFSSKEVIIANDSYGGRPLFTRSIDIEISYEKENIPKLFTEENIEIIQFNNATILTL